MPAMPSLNLCSNIPIRDNFIKGPQGVYINPHHVATVFVSSHLLDNNRSQSCGPPAPASPSCRQELECRMRDGTGGNIQKMFAFSSISNSYSDKIDKYLTSAPPRMIRILRWILAVYYLVIRRCKDCPRQESLLPLIPKNTQ